MQQDPLDVNLTRALDESKRLADSIKPGSDRWDVIVVGSGAAGGMAAFQLATAGIKVLLLEAGRMIDHSTEYRTMEWPYASNRARPPAARRHGRSTSPSTTSSIARTAIEPGVRQVQEGGVVRGQHASPATGSWTRRQNPTTGHAVLVGARARPRRQDELLGPRRAALRAAAVQRRQPRRLRRGLADLGTTR